MPIIREYNRQVSAQAPGGAGRVAQVSDFVGTGRDDMGKSLVAFGATLDRVADHIDNVRRTSMLSSANAQATQELQEYAFTLERGSVNPDGTLVPPPDPGQHYDLYTKKVKDINDRVKARFGDDDLYGLFEQDFGKVVLKQSFEVRKNVIEKQRGMALAEFNATEDTLADVYANGDAFTRANVAQTYRSNLGRFVAAGVIDPVTGQKREEKFLSMLERADVRELTRKNPDAAVQAMLDGNQFKRINPDEREKWLSLATGESERRRTADIAEDERIRREAERAQRDAENTTFKNAMDMAAGGRLSVKWVQANRDTIAKSDYDNLIKLAAKGGGFGGGGEGNAEVYADLRIRAGRGEDVREEAKKAFTGGKIKAQQYSGIVGEVETNSAPVREENWYRSGKDFLNRALAPSQINPGIDRQVLANALDDWQRYSAGEGQKATPAERERVREQILNSSRVVQSADVLSSIPTPRFLVGTKGADANIAQTVKRTEEAFAKGEISRFEFDREGRNIQQLDRWLKTQAAKPKPSDAKKGK